MVLERMIEAGMNEFKENLMRSCERDAQDGLSPEAAHVVTQGIQRAVAAEALFGKGSNEATAWYNKYRKKLLEQDLGARGILRAAIM